MTISPQWIQDIFHHYGGVGIFCLFSFGIIGLPVPDETLLVIIGFLIAESHLPIVQILFAVYMGSITGITVSYLIGIFTRKQLLFRFAERIGITPAKMTKAHDWYQKRGKWSLLIGYYIPGVRHLLGIIAGSTGLTYGQFALFAYSGAFIWNVTFLSIGYFFFNEWQHFSLV